MFQQEVSLLAAFGAGIISFVSPCVLPIIPGYLSFVSGVSVEELQGGENRGRLLKRVSLTVLFFILGFSAVFVALGASASAFGLFLATHRSLFNKIAGVIIFIFGLHLLGILRIPFLNYEARFQARTRPLGLVGAFGVGLAFAFGWSPCLGPILGAILGIAANQETVGQGMLLLSSYSLGLGVPFFLAAIGFNSFLSVSRWVKKHFRAIEITSGAFLVLVAVLIFTDQLAVIARVLLRWFPWLNEIG